MSLAPLRTVRFTSAPMTGCCSVVLEPMMKKALALARSSMLLVIAPLPNDVPRPDTLGACQRRAQ